ncbi:transposase, partial [Streptomyces collinus]
LLGPYRGQPSPITSRGGKWEVHTNPHDVRQIWLRLPDGELAEVPWIHRAHVHRPFNEQTWQYIRTTLTHHTDPDSREADLADALDQLMRRARTGHATKAEHRLITRTTPARTPLPPRAAPGRTEQEPPTPSPAPAANTDSLDHLDDTPDEPHLLDQDAEEGDASLPAIPYTGLGLYDAQAEALKW